MQGIKGKRRRYENGIAIKSEHNYSQRLPALRPKEEEKKKKSNIKHTDDQIPPKYKGKRRNKRKIRKNFIDIFYALASIKVSVYKSKKENG